MQGAPHPDPTDNGPDDADPLADGTLGGYFGQHNRPPGFEGPDGYPYTVSLEVENTPRLQAPFSGYLVFPRWTATGVGIVGHLETPILLHGRSRKEVTARLEALTLLEVNTLLREAIIGRRQETE